MLPGVSGIGVTVGNAPPPAARADKLPLPVLPEGSDVIPGSP